MKRRELLKIIAVLTGSTVAGSEIFLSGCRNPSAGSISFSEETIALLDEVGETILPRTKTPGAKDAAIGKFMQLIVTDCYYPADQQIFMTGIETLQKTCKSEYGKTFTGCTAAERTELVKRFDTEAKEHSSRKMKYDAERNGKTKGTLMYKKDLMPDHWFTFVKQLTLWGFFTSKPGATEALRYVPVPGKYEGDVPYIKGDRALFPCY